MSALSIVEPNRLDHLADVANGKHREAYKAAMTMLYAGIEAGEALIEAKSLVKHGEWVPWVRANCQFGDTAATSYMMVARHKDYLLAQPDVDTLQKAILKLKAEKLTTQTRIDDERIAEIRQAAEEHGINGAARLLGESYGTVHRYASGFEKTKRVKALGSGRQQRVAINSLMVERMAEWLVKRLGKGQPVNDKVRELALEALRAALDATPNVESS
jgi:Protein of unknown function (DUF3102)